MASIYDDMADALTDEMADVFDQGGIQYRPPPTVTGPDYAPVETPSDPVDVAGTVSGVAQQYVDDSTIYATDQMAILPTFSETPTNAGTLLVDGDELQIIKVDRIPGAGTVVAWRVFVRS